MRRNSREKILKEAGELFSESGFFGTSMGDIAKSLNITKAALYYYFKSKRGLYLEVLNRAFQKLAKNLKRNVEMRSLEQTLFHSIRNYLEWGTKEKNLIKAQMAKFPESDLETQKSVLKLRGEIEGQFEGIFKNVLDKEIDLKIFISFLLGIMDRIILETAFLGKELNIKKKTSQILKILNPIFTPTIE